MNVHIASFEAKSQILAMHGHRVKVTDFESKKLSNLISKPLYEVNLICSIFYMFLCYNGATLFGFRPTSLFLKAYRLQS